MKKYLIAVASFFSIHTVLAQVPEKQINAIIKEAIASKRSKSIVISIIDSNGRKIYSGGILSDTDKRIPDGYTMYEIGSITKVFTSLVLADQVLKKKLNLDDPIAKFLPKGVTTPSTHGKEISLFNLAVHTSGFPRFPYNVNPKNLDNPYADYTYKQLLTYVSAYQPHIPINSKWRYSNIAYGLLGYILTKNAKEKSYESLIVNQVCKPLQLANTVITLSPQQRKNTATGHAETGEHVPFINLSAIEGGGALLSNAEDLLTFAAANLGFVQSDLSPAMKLTHVKQLKKEADGNEYATMGWTFWEKGNTQLLFKDGGTPGFRTFIGIDKKRKFGVVVLSNSNNGVTDIGKHIMDTTLKVTPYTYSWNLLDTLRTCALTKGVDATVVLYQAIKASPQLQYVFNENQLNYLGHELRKRKRITDAIKIFELNIDEYPNSPMVYESLGELYQRNGNKKAAIACFEKARKLQPENLHWDFIIKELN